MKTVIIGCIVWGIVWGVVTNKIIENKGYDEDWFWWGFFFGFLATIVALSKPAYNNNAIESEFWARLNASSTQTAPKDGWKCNNCGKINYSYYSSCECGNKKYDNKKQIKPKDTASKECDITTSTADEIMKLKKLLDAGAITQEEFDKMKSQLLGL